MLPHSHWNHAHHLTDPTQTHKTAKLKWKQELTLTRTYTYKSVMIQILLVPLLVSLINPKDECVLAKCGAVNMPLQKGSGHPASYANELPPPSSVFHVLLSCWHSLRSSTVHCSIVIPCPCSAGIRQDNTQQNEDPRTLVKKIWQENNMVIISLNWKPGNCYLFLWPNL